MQSKSAIDRPLHPAAGAVAMLALLAGVSFPATAALRPAPDVPKTVETERAEPQPAAAPTTAAAPSGAPTTDGFSEFYDRSNPDLVNLQQSGEALLPLPKDRDGKVDWMNALRSGAIVPRGKIDGAPTDPPLDLDIIMKNTKLMPYVRFPHRAHTEWLACSNCHPALFAEKAGTAQIKMEDIFRGRFCGTCHDRVAFLTHRNCDRCHSVPR